MENVPRFEEVATFRNTLNAESDRGCALMSAAYLDSQLEELLRVNFIADSKVADELLAQSKPLSTFSSRIDLAYLLGRIGKMAHRDLHLIRKIRNEFGHTSAPLDFNHPAIAARCRELYYCIREVDVAPRKRFTNTVLGVLACIHGATQHTSQPEVATDVEITPRLVEKVRKTADVVMSVLERLNLNKEKKAKRLLKRKK